MRDDFVESIKKHQHLFSLHLNTEQAERLADYYDLVREQNESLNLVASSTAEEFAVRHILESLTLLEFLPREAKFADVGTGAGLPSMPCLIVREGLRAILIESKEKKAKFLSKAVNSLGLNDRAVIAHNQFEEVDPADCKFVTCRALDKFTTKLPRLLKWSKPRRLLLFGGNNLGDALHAQRVEFTQKLMPLSEQRFLFVI
jgi:16S rRNA (guanine527-N7)-methyltransferase